MKIVALQKHIETLYRAGKRYTLFLQGPPGIGKSEAGINVAKTMKINYLQWQATIEDPLELPGLPAVVGGKAKRLQFEDKIPGDCSCQCKKCCEGECVHCLGSETNRDNLQRGGKRCFGAGLLIIDEINSAPPLTQASLYSLVWDGKLGGSILGKNWMIIATGNRAKDRGVTQKMPTPLVSRMEHIEMEPDYDGWLVYMALLGGHDSVRSFIKLRTDLFENFKADKPGPFACPRTWKMVSDLMLAYGKNDPPIEAVEGWVGPGPAKEFLVHHTMAMALIDPEEIIKNPEKVTVPKEPGALYALTTALASRANYNNITQIIKFLDRIHTEYAVYCIQTVREVERGRIEKLSEGEKEKYKPTRQNDAFKKWALQHYEIIVD